MAISVGRLRPVDLARRAGLSTQAVRNYETAGVLPPAPRTETGYRQYEEKHLAALLAYRALVPGFGPDPASSILRAVHAGDVPLALRLIDAGHAALHDQRLATDAANHALSGLAAEILEEPDPQVPSLLVGELAAQLGVRPSALRVWESAGLLSPDRERITKYRRYGPDQVRDAKIIHMLRQGRYSFDQIKPVLEGLRKAGSTEALRAAIAERRAAHDQQSRAMLHGAALLYDYLDRFESA